MQEIFNNDSLIILKQQPNNSIDCCITDPPYGLTHLSSEFDNDILKKTPAGGGAFKSKNLGGSQFKTDQNNKLTIFIQPFLNELYRVLKPGSFCIIFSQGRLLLGMLTALEKSNFEIREQFYWRKPTAKPNIQTPKGSGNFYNRKILGPGKFIEPFIIAQKPKEGTFANNWNKWGVGLVDEKEANSTVWDFPCEKEKDDSTHPTIKPIDLMRKIVRSFTKENDLIIDPFSGSGSTGVACVLENRNYLGIEINKIYFQESQKRLDYYKDLEKNKTN